MGVGESVRGAAFPRNLKRKLRIVTGQIADQQALGSVSVYRKDTGPILGLGTGWLNSCSPAALAMGRVVMSSLCDRLRVICGAFPRLRDVGERYRARLTPKVK